MKRVHFIIKYQPKQCFETFVNGVVEARRQGDLNPDSAVCANIEKVVGNSAYGYQIMDRSRHTRTKYVTGSSVNNSVNETTFRKFNELPNEFYEVELGKSKVEHKEPIIVGFFILQYAKLVMLELVYNFFVPFCGPDKYGFIEMDTDSLYLSINGSDLENIIKPEKKSKWNLMRSNDCRDNFTINSISNFSLESVVKNKTSMIRELRVFSKKNFDARRWLPYAQKRTAVWMKSVKTVKLSSKSINQTALLNNSPMQKYRSVLVEQAETETTNRGFIVQNN